MRYRLLSTLLTCSCALVSVTAQQHQPQQKPDHMQHRFDDPERYAKSFDDPARDAWQMPARVIEALKLSPASTVADIGAGTGYFTVRLAKAAPRGTVYAVDIEPAMLEHIRKRATTEGLGNIVTVQASDTSPKLSKPVDVVLIVDTYHHLPNRAAYFRELTKSLATGGRVAIVDFRKDSPDGPPREFRFDADQIIAEMKQAGYEVDARHDFLPRQHFLVFRPANAMPQNANSMSPEERARMDAQNAELRTLLQSAAKLPMPHAPVAVSPPAQEGWAMGMVSWIAADRKGLIYLLQRGDKADPVVVIDGSGKVVRSWGKGMYTTPHAIRIDREGNVWTTDAASSMVYKFSPEGKTLLQIEVGGQPAPCGNFCSTTDIAFAPDGHLFIADGYRNARILEYSADGQKLREWGKAGTGPGEFRLPHSIQVDASGTVYVADRENGRIQRFDRTGKYLGEWSQYGKTFGLTLAGDALWLSTIPRGPNSTPGWLIKIDRTTGKLLGYVDAMGNHGMDVMPSGDLLQAPGPDQIPQRYQAAKSR